MRLDALSRLFVNARFFSPVDNFHKRTKWSVEIVDNAMSIRMKSRACDGSFMLLLIDIVFGVDCLIARQWRDD